jgi:hypothetical protein
MPNPNSVPYNTYLEETKNAIETCYPIEEGTRLIGATTLLHEINYNSYKYPLYSKIELDQNKKLVMTHNCLDDLKWERWGKAGGSCRKGAVFIRSV